jgi:predicted DNA-binding transcriptional regulator YafY
VKPTILEVFCYYERMSKSIKILYKNWKNETSIRHIQPIQIWYGSTEWHKEDQWLMKALDLDKDEERDFALKDIIEWL